jgi:hypothetical protein
MSSHDTPQDTRVWVNGSYHHSSRSDGNIEITLTNTSHYRSPLSRQDICVLPWPTPEPSSPAEELALREFMSAFPTGFKVGQTTFIQYLCGFQALVQSTADQHPHLPKVEIDEDGGDGEDGEDGEDDEDGEDGDSVVDDDDIEIGE